MSKKRKEKYVDDGHTIYNMNIEGFKWYNPNHDKKDELYIEKKEKWAIIKAAFSAYFPKLMLVLLSFGLAILLIYLWLS